MSCNSKLVPMSINQTRKDPWHFSYLGENYFLQVANNLGYVNLKYAQIEDLYIGSTGVEYKEKQYGLNVNPNWCVRMKNGKEYRFGTKTKDRKEPGLWDLNHCNHYKWKEIKDFYSK